MTGQGNKQHQQIKNAAVASRSGINLHKTYRTRSDCRVRSLHTDYTQLAVIDGQIKRMGNIREVIAGQVFQRNAQNQFEWQDQIWEITGRHPLHSVLDLIESRETPSKQLQLI